MDLSWARAPESHFVVASERGFYASPRTCSSAQSKEEPLAHFVCLFLALGKVIMVLITFWNDIVEKLFCSCCVTIWQQLLRHFASFSTRNFMLNTLLRKPIRMQYFIQLCDSFAYQTGRKGVSASATFCNLANRTIHLKCKSIKLCDFKMDLMKWQLNWVERNCGLKLCLWFQRMQTKFHCTQFNYHY